jgi:hypothetical protein
VSDPAIEHQRERSLTRFANPVGDGDHASSDRVGLADNALIEVLRSI